MSYTIAATSRFKQLSTAETCSISSSSSARETIFLTLSKCPSLYLTCKPVKLSLSDSFTPWVSQNTSKFSPFGILPLMAMTPDLSQTEKETIEEEITFAESGGEKEVLFEDGSEECYEEPPQEVRIYVGNLPYEVDCEGLAQLFNQAGVVKTAQVLFSRKKNRSRGYGFVTMSNVEEAQRAVGMFNRYVFHGRCLFVNRAAPTELRPGKAQFHELGYRIYAGNLPWEVDDARLRQIFSEYGNVVSARVVCDQETGYSRGFGFVTMSTERELKNATAALDGQVM
ncbi:hypothetical protein K2173_021244 [Erythroxylum novogranatense]|uniref:RRM domain-containing protein n=1 Tax=Erythroxylum novogranatense TaxID=1862640 RepID=A0AAV8TQD3_9ROSI|nr:hypothetical protein K2173_021244 [Erythroxylum novogranatense]